jgi:hypothetical protein
MLGDGDRDSFPQDSALLLWWNCYSGLIISMLYVVHLDAFHGVQVCELLLKPESNCS